MTAAPCGALPEVAGDAALSANPDDPAEPAAVIHALATDEPSRAALAEAGRQRAQQFDVTTIAARLAALRHDLLARRG